MSAETKPRAPKVSRREFTERIANRAGVPPRVAAEVYQAFIDEVIAIVRGGENVNLSGFGLFYGQVHKGHAVQFNPDRKVDDYKVLKFSATRATNLKLDAKNDGKDSGKDSDDDDD